MHVSASNQSYPTNVYDCQKSQPYTQEMYYWRLQLEVCSLLSVFPFTFSRVMWSPYEVKGWVLSSLCPSPELKWSTWTRAGGGGCRWDWSGHWRCRSTPGSGVAPGLPPRLPPGISRCSLQIILLETCLKCCQVMLLM